MQQFGARRAKNHAYEAGHQEILGGILRHLSFVEFVFVYTAPLSRNIHVVMAFECFRSWLGHSHGEATLAPSQEVFRGPHIETTPRITVIYPCAASPVPSLLGVSIGFHRSFNSMQSHSLVIADGDSIMSYRDVCRPKSKHSFFYIT